MFLCSRVLGLVRLLQNTRMVITFFLITLIKSSHIYKRLIITIYDKPYYKIWGILQFKTGEAHHPVLKNATIRVKYKGVLPVNHS